MPLIVEDGLPSGNKLGEEQIFVIDKSRAGTQDIRPVDIAILNLMPNKEETEVQLLRALSNTPLQVNIDLIKMGSYESQNTSKDYLERFYKNFSDIKDKKYDGLIVTGAPVEKMDFDDVKYWDELQDLFDFAKTNVYSTIFICWAAQAALYHYYGIPKHDASKKIFGVYHFDIERPSLLTRGLGPKLISPQSRHTYTSRKDVEAVEDLVLICHHEDTGVGLCTSRDQRFVFMAGHNEYETYTLYHEYERDLNQGKSIEKPVNYFEDDGKTILNTWMAHTSLFYSNWLNHCVYQRTPFDIQTIKEKEI